MSSTWARAVVRLEVRARPRPRVRARARARGLVFGYGCDGFLVVLMAKNAANGAVNKYLFNLWF